MKDEREIIISCKNLCVGYGEELVIDSANLEIRRGEFLPFVGPNGAGKTTFLRTILGQISPRSGKVITPFATKAPGYVPQFANLDLIFPITAREIVLMGYYPLLGNFGAPDKSKEKAVDEILERFKLQNAGEKTFSELSGGMRQKILIARAIIGGADVLIMDEPTTGLDEGSEIDLLKMLADLVKADGKTVLFAQHGLELVSEMVSMICRIQRGQVERVPIEKAIAKREGRK